MAPVKMYIDKFNGIVTIDDQHPLAVAQREKDAKNKAPSEGDLSRKTVAQLTELCEAAGIEVPDGSTKKEIIALLEAPSE